jgi:heavy metal sensor kinase
MMSVRRRLLLGTAVATTAIFLAAAVSLYFLARHFLIAELDAALRAKARAVLAMTDVADAGVHLEAEDAQKLAEFQPGPDAQYFEIVTQDGQSVAASPSLQDKHIPNAQAAQRPQAGVRFLQLPDGRPGRAATIIAKTQVEDEHGPVASSVPEILAVTVAKSTAELDRFLSRLRTLLGVVCGLATLTLLALTAWVIRQGLHPVRRLAGDISRIGADDLGERLDPAHVPTELAPIVSRLNELLGRVEAAFEREKCFTADAAHELRTPLAGVAAALEVCARERRDVPRYERVISDCLKAICQMHAMIDNLLLLARADAHQVPVNRARVDLARTLRESWSRVEQTALQRRLHVEVEIPDQLELLTDREKLGIILNNLFDNAVHYADDNGQVRISATVHSGRVRVSISNSGSRVREDQTQQVFDRFWRGDRARSSGGRNCGLGLAVCRKLADALDAQLRVSSTRGGWFTVELDLPAPLPSRGELQPVNAEL